MDLFEQQPQTDTMPGWSAFWAAWPHKVDKQAAKKAYKAALRIATPQLILQGVERYKAQKPDWQAWKGPAAWLRNRKWEDEPVIEPAIPVSDPDQRLRDIANTVRKPWCTVGRYDRDTLQQCVDAGLLTKDEMEAKL